MTQETSVFGERRDQYPVLGGWTGLVAERERGHSFTRRTG